jgi:agmatine/peptidylarginine deiminase
MFEEKKLIAEFEPQSFTQLIFPHAETDWVEYLHEAEETFVKIVNAIVKFQPCLLICHDIAYVKAKFNNHKNIHFVAYVSDDTWARDCSALSLREHNTTKLLNFRFNGWGNKFEAKKDNALSRTLAMCYANDMDDIDFILEGGAIESNGVDTLLTTAQCMLNPNRNPNKNAVSITQKLKEYFGVKHILYLNHGYLAGDDTDSHIDTLARFVAHDTIMYVKCSDKTDEHYKQLKLMEDELRMLAKERGYKCIPLPMPDAIYFNNERLPATYANFLFVNGAVLVPTYNVAQDKTALETFQKTFPNREIIPIDSSVLIRQHGSLHCVTMNFSSDIKLNCNK